MSDDDFILALRTRRKDWGITLGRLGRAMHVSGTAIHNWEAGIRTPSADMLRRWADALQCDLVLLPRESGRTSRDGLSPCGTWNAAKRHRYHGQTVCPLCRLAERRRNNDLNAKRRAARLTTDNGRNSQDSEVA